MALIVVARTGRNIAKNIAAKAREMRREIINTQLDRKENCSNYKLQR